MLYKDLSDADKAAVDRVLGVSSYKRSEAEYCNRGIGTNGAAFPLPGRSCLTYTHQGCFGFMASKPHEALAVYVPFPVPFNNDMVPGGYNTAVKWWDACLAKGSPYWGVAQYVEIIKDADGRYCGYGFTNMGISPQLAMSLMMALRAVSYCYQNLIAFKKALDAGMSARDALIVGHMIRDSRDKPLWSPLSNMGTNWSLRKVLDATPSVKSTNWTNTSTYTPVNSIWDGAGSAYNYLFSKLGKTEPYTGVFRNLFAKMVSTNHVFPTSKQLTTWEETMPVLLQCAKDGWK
jgi:hypothetical protein